MRMRQLHNDGVLNIESIVYKSAMEKIDEASARFDRGKDVNILKVCAAILDSFSFSQN